MGLLRLTTICSDEEGACDGEVWSRLLLDSESSSDDDDDDDTSSRVWFSYSQPETGVVLLRLTPLCGDDGGDRRASRACNCTLA